MADHRKRRNKQFRREIANKIADIQDKYCSPCEIKDCKNCDHDRTLKHYGNLLLQDSKDRRSEKKKTQIQKEERQVRAQEMNGLTKEKYKMLKDEGKTDKEIVEAYKMHNYTLTTLKERWGLLGYRGKKKPVEVEKATEIKVEKERYEEKQEAQQEKKQVEQPVKDSVQEPSEKLTESFPEARELAIKIKSLQEEKNHLWKENKEQSLRIGRLLNENAALEERIEMLEKEIAELEGQNRYKELYLSHAAALRAHLMDV
ncbi:hypothetical protein AMD02_015645 [Halalkalibacterium halodurans]|uniref:Uncharacterized protein n=1 Tax=Halalkalibacterium halodurans TaxID=86665 RepID=A0A0M0KIU1_ALKHA|nr:hypothetical protein AMD02_015645 [Halalkalibacterium halodurans]